MSNLPVFSADLIQQLDKEYPELCPSPSMSDREIWMATGARFLVRNLLERLRQLEDDPLMEN